MVVQSSKSRYIQTCSKEVIVSVCASLYGVARIGAWVVFAFFIPGSILNLSSPSKKEKLVMGPLNIIALICAFMVAMQ